LGASTRTRENTFYPEVSRVAERMRGNVEQLIGALRRENYYPSIDPPRLTYSTSLRDLTGGRAVEMSNPNGERGTIYYTVNGYDPRLPRGGVSPRAAVGDVSRLVVLGRSDTLKARGQGQ
jgi:hypothetical protein